jgi:SAM-dependent methyltransferase
MGTAEAQSELWGARARDWADVQEAKVASVYEVVLDELAVGQGTRLLDAGCGAGGALAMAAASGATVTGLDATPELIAIARERLPEAALRVGELEELPFDDGAFDAVTGFNSFQFAGNPANALREARRVARQGAAVGVVTWGRPEQCEAAAYLGALRPLMPPAPPGAPGPFALSEPGALEALVEEAGLTPERSGDMESLWEYDGDDDLYRGVLSAGPAVMAVRTSGEDAVREAVRAALGGFRTDSGGYRIANVFRYLIARA